jgi:predicted ester cyclase
MTRKFTGSQIGPRQLELPPNMPEADSAGFIAEGDRVVARWSAKGTHLGPFQGIPAEHMVPPTGKPVSFGATDIYRMVDGKVAEEWNTIEQLDLMVQIGALKLPG